MKRIVAIGAPVTQVLDLSVALHSAPAPRPSSFYGAITVDGSLVAEGLAITAEIGGTEYDAAEVFLAVRSPSSGGRPIRRGLP